VVGPPTYTRPALWDGEEVPGVLLSGDHAKIRAWRESEARERIRVRTSGKMPP
jgi:tRNA (guanine37-N1)-methyltransferase